MRLLAAFAFAALVPASLGAQTVLFADDFELGTGNWALTGNWRLVNAASDPCASATVPYPSGVQGLRWGSAGFCTFEIGPFQGTATLQATVALPASSGSIELSFATNSHAEDWPEGEWDARRVQISSNGGASWATLHLVYTSPWYRHVYDLTGYAGQAVSVRFQFDAVDGYGNWMRGWFLDDVALTSRAEPGVPFCFGDWCPCGNTGASGNGCATSINPAGGNLGSSGTASVAADSVVLAGSGLSNSVVTFFQGSTSSFDALSGSTMFGDGRRCATGTVVRLGSVFANSGAAVYPGPSHQPVSVRGAVPGSGGRRAYQVWYRNAADFCTTSTFNLTNGVLLTWAP